MEKIENEEYIRTDLGISKVIKELNNRVFVNNLGFAIMKKDISKHSKNIIDLIELGDILEIYMPIRDVIIKVNIDKYFTDSFIYKAIIDKKVFIKSILTKEQYSKNCYRLEE